VKPKGKHAITPSIQECEWVGHVEVWPCSLEMSPTNGPYPRKSLQSESYHEGAFTLGVRDSSVESPNTMLVI